MTEQPSHGPVARSLGVDACKKGWIGVSSDARAYFATSIASLVQLCDQDGAVAVIAIDIPIGLPVSGTRRADSLARSVVGRRASSVFTTPVRSAIAAGDYATANAANRSAAGQGISQQAFALGPKIREVDEWVRGARRRVVEVHPEVSFAALAGSALRHPKSTWAGFHERLALLRAAGFAPTGELGEAGRFASPDDMLDAAAACWTAERVRIGVATSLPSPPEEFGADALPAAIWR